MKTAIVIGATGLIGRHLISILLSDNRYSKVKVFSRRSIEILNPKLEEHIINFDELQEWKYKISGDELYSALGTTIRKVKSREKQYKIDVTYQYEFAKAAAENGMNSYCLVSSAGASSKSKIFYLRIKGELDDMVKQLSFKNIRIFRPSFLTGERAEKRFGEKSAETFLKILVPVFPFLRKQRPIEGEKVASAMVKVMNNDSERIRIIELDDIFKIA